MTTPALDLEKWAKELSKRSTYGSCRITFWTVTGIPVQWAIYRGGLAFCLMEKNDYPST